MKYTLSVLVEDESGVLSRISGLFARRGFNIESLAVGPAEQVSISRITMVLPGDNRTIEQLTKQLYKLCLLYTSPSPRDKRQSRMPSSA